MGIELALPTGFMNKIVKSPSNHQIQRGDWRISYYRLHTGIDSWRAVTSLCTCVCCFYTPDRSMENTKCWRLTANWIRRVERQQQEMY